MLAGAAGAETVPSSAGKFWVARNWLDWEEDDDDEEEEEDEDEDEGAWIGLDSSTRLGKGGKNWSILDFPEILLCIEEDEEEDDVLDVFQTPFAFEFAGL